MLLFFYTLKRGVLMKSYKLVVGVFIMVVFTIIGLTACKKVMLSFQKSFLKSGLGHVRLGVILGRLYNIIRINLSKSSQ